MPHTTWEYWVLPVGSVLPAASITYRSVLAVLQGTAGVADALYACMKLSDDTYVWIQIGGMTTGKAEFIGQNVYYEQLDIAGAAHTRYILLEDPEGVEDDNDPAQNCDSTLYSSSDAAEVLAIEATFINPHSDIRTVLNNAVCKAKVECGTNARITRITFTLGKHDLGGGAGNFTAIGSEVQPTNFSNLDGASSRAIRAIIDDIPRTDIGANERLALRIRVYGYRTAGAIAVPINLWHSRGSDEVMIEVNTLNQEV